jgi:penicillin-binding protein 2
VAGQYPPGSTFKPVVAMAGLESGAITPDKRIFCNGVVKLGNAKFHCWKARYGGHGWLDMKGAIEQSCDVYFYELARRLGLDRISAMATRFGLGEKLDVGLPAERGGLVPTRDWKLAVFGTPWQLGETLITGIGQAYLLATPLQLAVMTARIANGGRAVRPTLTRAVGSEQLAAERGAVPSMGLSRGNLQIVQAAMSEVVNSVHGTAHRYRLDDALGAKMAGKTGTAQVRRITKAERQAGGHLAEGTPWEERDHGLFVAFAPVDEPRYATAVVVEHAGSSSFAAEITRDVMTDVLQRDPLRRSPLGQLASRRARGERS